jgi:hypothetical protein
MEVFFIFYPQVKKFRMASEQKEKRKYTKKEDKKQ